MDNKTITHATLKQLINDGVIRSVSVVALGGRWELLVQYGRVEKYLRSTNNQNRRTWSKLDTVQRYLADMGVRQFSVDAAGFIPGEGRIKRPDRRAALERVHRNE
jgi:hypothetical protein